MIFVLQDGKSPLLIALENGHFDVVKTLIEAEANVNHRDKVGLCALLLYSISAHVVFPWFLLYLTKGFDIFHIFLKHMMKLNQIHKVLT